MTFFEQELKKMFAGSELLHDIRFVGNVCYGSLTEDIRVKAGFITCGYADHYEALKVTLINRHDGPIDSLVLPFRDILGKKQVNNPNFSDGLYPHVWKDNGKADWYVYHPAAADYKAIAGAASDYLGVFQEPVQEQQMGQKMC